MKTTSLGANTSALNGACATYRNIHHVDVPLAHSFGPHQQSLSKRLLCQVHAAANAAVELDTPSPRPPTYQEVWVAPNPSKLVKDKRAFVEEHR